MFGTSLNQYVPGLVVTALAWTVGITFIPISSCFSLGMIGLLLTSSINQNRRMKSSFVKCLEHIAEFLVNSHLTRFCFTKSIYFFLRFLASSLSNSIACRAIYPSTHQGRQHIHLPQTFLAHSKFSTDNVLTINEQMLCGRDTGSTSQASSSQSLNSSFSCIQYGGKRPPILGDFVV